MGETTCHLEFEPDGALLTVRVSGRIAGHELAGVKEKMRAAALTPACRGLILDLSGVGHFDSTMIGFLISTFRTAREHGRDMALVGLTGAGRETLRIMRLSSIFPVHESVEDARQALST